MLPPRLWQFFAQYGGALQSVIGPTTSKLDITISKHWRVVGPFQLGTREAAWGADPLELYGGFHTLSHHSAVTFTSSLPYDGTVAWSNLTAEAGGSTETSTSVRLHVDFPSVDWAFLQDVYGWAALQWQAWARGRIVVDGDREVAVACYTRQILEYWIDDQRVFGGDFYGYDRAPLVIRLEPGEHTLDVRLVRDTRAFGGIGPPGVDVEIELVQLNSAAQPLFAENILMSDIVVADSGRLLVSPLGSVNVRNDARQPLIVHSIKEVHDSCEVELLSDEHVVLAPGQTRPLGFRTNCKPFDGSVLDFVVNFGFPGAHGDDVHSLTFSPHAVDSVYDPQKMTYLHPSGIVSYAIVRPPSVNARKQCLGKGSLPILVVLHGAGVEADSDMARHALDALPDLCAWVVFPTGVTPWSGDDWHVWGGADIEAAVHAIPSWVERMKWTGPAPDISRWIVMGHSNGGQGTWHVLTHKPDRVVAAAPLSGYSSIQSYVPYALQRISDPGREAVVHAALLNYRHELLLENAQSAAIYQQHGSADDNVPAYHSRLMHHRLEQAGAESTYVEMTGKPHYWDGVMTTEPLRAFLEQQLEEASNSRDGAGNPARRPSEFSLVVANPADTGSKYGVKVEQLITPGRLARIDFAIDEATATCTIRTENVLQFLLPQTIFSDCNLTTVDAQPLRAPKTSSDGTIILTKRGDDWTTNPPDVSSEWRHPSQQGGLEAVLRSEGPFTIMSHSPAAADAALQISRNLCQYYAADTILADGEGYNVELKGNLISLAIGADLPPPGSVDFPLIVWASSKLSLRGPRGTVRDFEAGEHGLAAIFVRPLGPSRSASASHPRLELVVWGADEASLAVAARLVPLMTGTGQPDFVVLDDRMLWKGIDGALAMGFFDAEWEVSGNSFV